MKVMVLHSDFKADFKTLPEVEEWKESGHSTQAHKYCFIPCIFVMIGQKFCTGPSREEIDELILKSVLSSMPTH